MKIIVKWYPPLYLLAIYMVFLLSFMCMCMCMCVCARVCVCVYEYLMIRRHNRQSVPLTPSTAITLDNQYVAFVFNITIEIVYTVCFVTKRM